MFTPDTVSLVIMFGFMFLLSKAIGPREKGHAAILDAKTDLDEWMRQHDGIRPADYPQGRLLAETYRDAILARFHSSSESRKDPTYRAELARVERLLAPRRSDSFHAIA